MSVETNLNSIKYILRQYSCTLVAVSKNHPASSVLEAYETGHRDFGENKVQEMVEKHSALPPDIKWHMIGHLQRNKVKYIAPFVHLIHSIDSLKLLSEINKEGKKNNRIINCLLQIYIATEDTKFGLSYEEAEQLLISSEVAEMENIKIVGLMGMASNTENRSQIKKEFQDLYAFFLKCKKHFQLKNVDLQELSMGMSGDYILALEEGSTMIRIGTAIFGSRKY